MPKRRFDREAPFQSINGAAYLTGLSAGYIRSGCKANQIPHLMCGGEYRINMPLWLEQLRIQSAANAQGGDGK